MKPTFATILPALALGLGACGDPLGEYRAEDVRLVREVPPDLSITGSPLPYPQYVRIELSSQANLNAAKTGPGLYTHADYCPFREWNRIIAFGPLAGDGTSVESWKRRGTPAPDRRDGLYHYFVYVVPSSPPRKAVGNATRQIPGYDLRETGRDLCLRFFVPGYNFIASRSETVRIKAGSIAAALK